MFLGKICSETLIVVVRRDSKVGEMYYIAHEI